MRACSAMAQARRGALAGHDDDGLAVYITLIVLVALNLAPFETPKLGGRWYWAVVGYASVLSVVFAVQSS